MTADDARGGVILVRTWMHDGQLVARIHIWTTDDEDQQAVMVVGVPAVTERFLDWINTFERTPA